MENNTVIKTEWDLEKYFYYSLEDSQLDKDIEKYKSNVSEFKNRYKDKIAMAIKTVPTQFMKKLGVKFTKNNSSLTLAEVYNMQEKEFTSNKKPIGFEVNSK